MNFRPATLDDFDALHALFVACGDALATQGFDNWRDDPSARLRRDLASGGTYLAHDAHGALATFRLARTDDDTAYVGRVAVRPDAQAQGLGTACLREAEVRARALGATRLRLDVLAANARLRGFYERLGYEATGAEVERDGWRFASYAKALA